MIGLLRRWRYNRYIKSEKWKLKREAVLRRDGYRCFVCGNHKSLEAHHLTYKDFGKEKLYQIITLCRSCHKAIHKKVKIKDSIK